MGNHFYGEITCKLLLWRNNLQKKTNGKPLLWRNNLQKNLFFSLPILEKTKNEKVDKIYFDVK